MGLAPINTLDEREGVRKNNCKTVLYSLPAVLPIIVSLLLFQLSLLQSFLPDHYDKIYIIIVNVYYLMTTTSNVAANIQCLVYKRNYFNIVKRINVIHDLIIFQCKREINYHNFVKCYRMKFFAMFFLWFLMGLTSYVFYFEDFSENIVTTVESVLECIIFMSCANAILFVDYVGLFTKEMNETIVNTKSYFQSSKLAQIRAQNLVKLKYLHFEIWNLVQQINHFFGWLFVTLFIKYLVDIIYCLYWIFLTYEEFGWKSLIYLGKKIILI